MTEPCPSRVSARTRRPIARVDQGVYLERLHSKKKARAAHASNVTAKIREITVMLGDDQKTDRQLKISSFTRSSPLINLKRLISIIGPK